MPENREEAQRERVLLLLKAVVFLDFLGVAFVLPLLQQYYTDASITGRLLGLLSSTFSVAQFFAGIAVGIVADYAPKRDILLISFLGSLVSYAIIGSTTNIYLLFLSRVIVGLTKHTMTITQVAITELTQFHPELRFKHTGHISALAQGSFLIGPSIGGLLYRYDKRLPILCSVACFIANVSITYLFIPREVCGKRNIKKEDAPPKESVYTHMLHLVENRSIQQLLMLRTTLFFIEMGLGSRSIANYYQNKFNIPTDRIAYMSSLSSGISLVIQLFLLGPLMRVLHNDEVFMIFLCLAGEVLVLLIEGLTNTFHYFLIFSYIPNILISSVFSNIVKSYSTNIVPAEDTGKCIAVFNTLSSIASIAAPIYGAEVFLIFKEDAYKYKAYIAASHYIIPLSLVLHMMYSKKLK